MTTTMTGHDAPLVLALALSPACAPTTPAQPPTARAPERRSAPSVWTTRAALPSGPARFFGREVRTLPQGSEFCGYGALGPDGHPSFATLLLYGSDGLDVVVDGRGEFVVGPLPSSR